MRKNKKKKARTCTRSLAMYAGRKGSATEKIEKAASPSQQHVL
jgi:hypothetical protein